MLFDVPHACITGYAHAQVDVLSRIEEAASSGTEEELARALKWFLALGTFQAIERSTRSPERMVLESGSALNTCPSSLSLATHEYHNYLRRCQLALPAHAAP